MKRASYNVEMRNIYVLSDDGSRFELKDRVTLRPFESYVVANAATQALLKSLRLDGIVTGTELAETPADNSFRAWAADGRLHHLQNCPQTARLRRAPKPSDRRFQRQSCQ